MPSWRHHALADGRLKQRRRRRHKNPIAVQDEATSEAPWRAAFLNNGIAQGSEVVILLEFSAVVIEELKGRA